MQNVCQSALLATHPNVSVSSLAPQYRDQAWAGWDEKWANWDPDWDSFSPVQVQVRGFPHWYWPKETWRDRINDKLVELAATIPNSKNLEEFSLEASSDDDYDGGPLWGYLYDFTIRSLVSSLPFNLSKLILDICGSGAVTPDSGRAAIHLCPLIAERLRGFQNVRLRLRCICPEVLGISSLTPNAESRLKTLVIRLSVPAFRIAIDEPSKGNERYDAKPCVVKAIPLYKRMIAEGINFAKSLRGLAMMRISHRWLSLTDDLSSINLHVADCVTEQLLFDPRERLFYEDDGSQWEAWKDSDRLQEGGTLQEVLR